MLDKELIGWTLDNVPMCKKTLENHPDSISKIPTCKDLIFYSTTFCDMRIKTLEDAFKESYCKMLDYRKVIMEINEIYNNPATTTKKRKQATKIGRDYRSSVDKSLNEVHKLQNITIAYFARYNDLRKVCKVTDANSIKLLNTIDAHIHKKYNNLCKSGMLPYIEELEDLTVPRLFVIRTYDEEDEYVQVSNEENALPDREREFINFMSFFQEFRKNYTYMKQAKTNEIIAREILKICKKIGYSFPITCAEKYIKHVLQIVSNAEIKYDYKIIDIDKYEHDTIINYYSEPTEEQLLQLQRLAEMIGEVNNADENYIMS